MKKIIKKVLQRIYVNSFMIIFRSSLTGFSMVVARFVYLLVSEKRMITLFEVLTFFIVGIGTIIVVDTTCAIAGWGFYSEEAEE